MCYTVSNEKINLQQVVHDLHAESTESNLALANNISAFARPLMPVVLEHHGRKLTNAVWGLHEEIPKATPAKGLNLQAENSHTFYRDNEHQRCAVPVSSFYDFQHVPIPGKKTPVKVKHELRWEAKEMFYLIGFYDVWENNNIGFGLVTTLANPLMAEVHNSKLRMPIALDAVMAERFLNDEPIENFTYPHYDPNLVAINLEPHKMPNTLF